jgi:hypothetical protein
MRNFFNSILLFLIALILGIILIPISIVFTIPIVFIVDSAEAAYNKLATYIKSIAMGIDQLGNVTLEYGLNEFWITKDGYQFGNKMETISSALGKNQVKGTLTPFGWAIVNILDKINPNHCINAINNKV